MKLRLAAPALLVDLRRLPGLRGIQRGNGKRRIGAMAVTPTCRTRLSSAWSRTRPA